MPKRYAFFAVSARRCAYSHVPFFVASVWLRRIFFRTIRKLSSLTIFAVPNSYSLLPPESADQTPDFLGPGWRCQNQPIAFVGHAGKTLLLISDFVSFLSQYFVKIGSYQYRADQTAHSGRAAQPRPPRRDATTVGRTRPDR